MTEENLKIEHFFTRANANEGVKFFIPSPDGTGDSTAWIVVRGLDSDEYRNTKDQTYRDQLSVAALEDEELKEDAFKNNKIKLLSSLVVSWSFDIPCNQDNIKTLLTEAPYIGDFLDRCASKRANYFAKPQPVSSTTQDQS